MNNKIMTAAAMFLLSLSSLMAQQSQQSQRPFTLDDLMPGGATFYQASYPQTMYTTWWGEQLVEQDMGEVREITEDGTKKGALFRLADINAALAKAQISPVQHLYTTEFPYADRPLVLLDLHDRRALVDWEQRSVVWTQPKDTAASAEDWEPTSRNLAFVRAHNLYVTDSSGRTTAVSSDGSLDIEYGESVHRDEFGITKGTFWSPKGQRLAFYRMDQSMVTKYPQVDISARCAALDPDPYPMAGETSHEVSVGIYDVQTQQTVYLQTGDPKDRYFTNLAWSPDEQTLYLIELNRDQNHATLDAYDARTGQKIKTLLEERNEKYVEPLHPIQFLPWDATKFVYLTRNRDGWNHLFLGLTPRAPSPKGEGVTNLTKGDFEVIDLLGFNEKDKTIIYTSNEDDPIGCAVYSVDMKGHRKRISAKEGWHNASLSPAGSYIVDNWTWGGNAKCGRMIDLYPTNGKGRPISSEEGARGMRLLTAPEPWADFAVPEIRVGTLKAADGVTDLYYRLVLPTDFDPSKQYPAIVYVYGGPHAHNIDSSRHYGVRGWDVWMAQKGYVMFCLDNRGSEHRGLAFEQATFRRLGVEEMKDQMRGVEFLKSLPYVDASRLGVHGWSFGGFMTTSLMTTYPDVFLVGVAGGPVIDWKYYEVMYGERYMDTPQQNPEGYAETSLLAKAGNLQGRLLLIYGGNDPTCVPQHTLSFIRASIDAGTHPDLFTYPGDGHNMMGTDRVHLHEHISRYFDDHLK